MQLDQDLSFDEIILENEPPYPPFVFQTQEPHVFFLWWHLDSRQESFDFDVELNETSFHITFGINPPTAEILAKVSKNLGNDCINLANSQKMSWTIVLPDNMFLLLVDGKVEKILSETLFGFSCPLVVRQHSLKL